MAQCFRASTGLTARLRFLWARDVSRAHKVAPAFDAGMVWVNCFGNVDPIPHFGGHRQSGVGREPGEYWLDLYAQLKFVYVRL